MIVEVLSYVIEYFRRYGFLKHFWHRINAEIYAYKYSQNALLEQMVVNVLGFIVAITTITIQSTHLCHYVLVDFLCVRAYVHACIRHDMLI